MLRRPLRDVHRGLHAAEQDGVVREVLPGRHVALERRDVVVSVASSAPVVPTPQRPCRCLKERGGDLPGASGQAADDGALAAALHGRLGDLPHPAPGHGVVVAVGLHERVTQRHRRGEGSGAPADQRASRALLRLCRCGPAECPCDGQGQVGRDAGAAGGEAVIPRRVLAEHLARELAAQREAGRARLQAGDDRVADVLRLVLTRAPSRRGVVAERRAAPRGPEDEIVSGATNGITCLPPAAQRQCSPT
jgi:hypothetical protein